jgi:hypothetical protein
LNLQEALFELFGLFLPARFFVGHLLNSRYNIFWIFEFGFEGIELFEFAVDEGFGFATSQGFHPTNASGYSAKLGRKKTAASIAGDY